MKEQMQTDEIWCFTFTLPAELSEECKHNQKELFLYLLPDTREIVPSCNKFSVGEKCINSDHVTGRKL